MSQLSFSPYHNQSAGRFGRLTFRVALLAPTVMLLLMSLGMYFTEYMSLAVPLLAVTVALALAVSRTSVAIPLGRSEHGLVLNIRGRIVHVAPSAIQGALQAVGHPITDGYFIWVRPRHASIKGVSLLVLQEVPGRQLVRDLKELGVAVSNSQT